MNPIAKKIAVVMIAAAPIAGGMAFQASRDGRVTTRQEPYSLLCDSDAIKLSDKKVYIVKEGSFTDNLIKTFKNRTDGLFNWRPTDVEKYMNDPVYRMQRNQTMLDVPSGIAELMKKELRMDYLEKSKIKTVVQDTVNIIKKVK